jgi:hypothetical protein
MYRNGARDGAIMGTRWSFTPAKGTPMDAQDESWITHAAARIDAVIALAETGDTLDENITMTQMLVDQGKVDTAALDALTDAREALATAVDELAALPESATTLATPHPDVDALLAEAEDAISHASRQLAASGNTLEMQLASEVVYHGGRTIARTRAALPCPS